MRPADDADVGGDAHAAVVRDRALQVGIRAGLCKDDQAVRQQRPVLFYHRRAHAVVFDLGLAAQRFLQRGLQGRHRTDAAVRGPHQVGGAVILVRLPRAADRRRARIGDRLPAGNDADDLGQRPDGCLDRPVLNRFHFDRNAGWRQDDVVEGQELVPGRRLRPTVGRNGSAGHSGQRGGHAAVDSIAPANVEIGAERIQVHALGVVDAGSEQCSPHAAFTDFREPAGGDARPHGLRRLRR